MITKESEKGKGVLSDLFTGTGMAPVVPPGPGTPLRLPEEKEVLRLAESLKSSVTSVENYRDLQHVQLTKIQMRLLEGITEEKIESASLGEITKAFDTMKKNELLLNGKATQIQGIVGYLIQIEKEELEAQNKPKVIDMNYSGDADGSSDSSFEADFSFEQ